MDVFAGTSGFSYKEWKGTFYPEGLSERGMLGYYASRLPAVEINASFYRMPKADMLAKWKDETPASFRFALKASRRITHIKRLRDCASEVEYFFKSASALGSQLGPVLFQLPPVAKKDTPLLRDFIAGLPKGRLAAFEFRNATWFADDVFEVLRDGDAALCTGDVDDEGKSPPFVVTASWGYLRLRKTEYAPGEIEGWAERAGAQSWGEAFVFFKHEVQGPLLAERFLASRTGPGAAPANS